MTMWIAVLLACVACFALKFVGYLVPESWVSGGRTSRITTLLPVALLAGLLAVQTLVGSGGSLVIDARVGAIAVAIVLLLLRANFIIVVLAAAVVAGVLRATSPRRRTACVGMPSTRAPRAPSGSSVVASGTAGRPASARAAAMSADVRAAVPDGASTLFGWCSSMTSTDS